MFISIFLSLLSASLFRLLSHFSDLPQKTTHEELHTPHPNSSFTLFLGSRFFPAFRLSLSFPLSPLLFLLFFHIFAGTPPHHITIMNYAAVLLVALFLPAIFATDCKVILFTFLTCTLTFTVYSFSHHFPSSFTFGAFCFFLLIYPVGELLVSFLRTVLLRFHCFYPRYPFLPFHFGVISLFDPSLPLYPFTFSLPLTYI